MRHGSSAFSVTMPTERLLDVLRKRINHSAFVITFVCSEEPAVNERVDPGAMKFDGKTENVAPRNDAFGLRRFPV